MKESARNYVDVLLIRRMYGQEIDGDGGAGGKKARTEADVAEQHQE